MQFSRRCLSSTASTPSLARLRIVALNDVYELSNLARLQTFLKQLDFAPDVVCLTGDFLSPSPLSALDKGKGAVAALRAVGITHLSLGNHEADLKFPALKKRLREISAEYSKTKKNNTITKRKQGPVVLNSNVGHTDFLSTRINNTRQQTDLDLAEETRSFDIVTTRCGSVRVALLGLLSDEPGIFRDGTFRGLEIHDVTKITEMAYRKLVLENRDAIPTKKPFADWILPLTHQTLKRDEELANLLMRVQPGENLILGGHEHTRFDVIVNKDSSSNTDSTDCTRILKSGTDAEGVNLIDLTFRSDTNPVRLEKLEATWVDLKEYEPSSIVQSIIDSHLSLLTAMENEDVLHAAPLLPSGMAFSSKGPRLKQTTVGGIFCTCIKEELDVDAAIINGATIKGDTRYELPNMTYAQLKKELPFPTKMVVVRMTRRELQNAIHYSRTQNPSNDIDGGDGPVERKGYLQVDFEFERSGFYTGKPDDELAVAVPRNLLYGFCKIEPLMKVGERLKNESAFPDDDEFVPAVDLIVRHSSRERWYEMFHQYSFQDLDVTEKGYLTREDITRIVGQAVGHEPSTFLVNDMMSVVDDDENGVIDAGEFSHLLATVEREHFNPQSSPY
eukprot:CAMPEP_0198141438 /NCGR_PEP_ID=MMETSP1443-20131203/4434_1 /TAXON_ID=186043 /ORGANISM="Entomoneis sp., Strain CCMP2396" /LENGTH=616 /DNA_ID=CAMNT_0043804187 /DNA_START=58 /DNA_END=1908 /DNA_ORIENTATION=+